MCLEEQMAVPPSVLPLGFQIAEEAGEKNTKTLSVCPHIS